jgi:hypothetical protein
MEIQAPELIERQAERLGNCPEVQSNERNHLGPKVKFDCDEILQSRNFRKLYLRRRSYLKITSGAECGSRRRAGRPALTSVQEEQDMAKWIVENLTPAYIRHEQRAAAWRPFLMQACFYFIKGASLANLEPPASNVVHR